MTEVSDNGWRITVRAALTSSWVKYCSVIILLTTSSRYSSVLFVSVSCTVRIGTGGDLYGAIFLSLEKTPLMNLSIIYVLKRTRTARFWTIPNMKSMLLSPTQTCITIVPTTLTFSLVALSSRALSPGRIDSSQSGSARSACSRLGQALVSKTKLIGRIREAFKPNLMVTS